ncbi:hypothetical protein S301_08655 [Salmonella enterica subsp. enterica]|uniref:Phage tail protein n=1 Tax=Salmonella enterica I TaxID=59201 RepID=A0A5U3EXM5_SALET|nr:hypothetical protein [Salmonella enterica subsp. enterica]
MTKKFFSVVTTAGLKKITAATTGKKMTLTQMSVGDGGGKEVMPDPAQNALVGEKYRADLNQLYIDPGNSNQIIAEILIPESTGGFWIREAGVFDADGVLIAVCNMPEAYKPVIEEGAGRIQTIRIAILISDTSNISLSIDGTTITATRDYVDNAVKPFLKIKENLSEIAAAGEDAQDDARRHLALGKLAIKDSLGPEDVNALAKDQNLNDVPDKAKARTALALGNSATRDVGTTAETVAAGDDSRITGAMQKDQNGADIPDKTLFVQNLDLTDTVNRASHVQASDGNIYGSCWGGWLNDYIRRNTPGMPSLDPYATTDWVNRYFANKSTASLATNGWFRDATTGFMIQWGTAPGGTGTFIVNLPQPFPRATLWVLGWVDGALNYGDDDWSNSAGIINNSQISVTTDHGWSTSWIAIGY